jgi:hypothetical protein
MESFWDDGGGWWHYTNKGQNFSFNQAPWPGETTISVAPVRTPWQPRHDPGPVIHITVNPVVRGPIAGVDHSFPKGNQFQPIHPTNISQAIYHTKPAVVGVRFTALQPAHHLQAFLPSPQHRLGITPGIGPSFGSLFPKYDWLGRASASMARGRKPIRPVQRRRAPPPLTPTDLYEGGVFEGLQILRNKVEFGRSTGSIWNKKMKFDEDFWEVWLKNNDEYGNPVPKEEDRERILQLKLDELAPDRVGWASGRTPADAVAAIFAHPEKWKFDCAEFVQAVELYAILKALGPHAFNDRIRARHSGPSGLVFRFMEAHSTGLIIVNGWERRDDGTFTHITEQHQEGRPVRETNMERVLAEAPVGAEVIFHNPLDDKKRPWRNEHAIKLGPDIYYAHGVSRVPVSRRVIETKMAEEYFKVAGTKVEAVLAKIYVGAVAQYKIK